MGWAWGLDALASSRALDGLVERRIWKRDVAAASRRFAVEDGQSSGAETAILRAWRALLKEMAESQAGRRRD